MSEIEKLRKAAGVLGIDADVLIEEIGTVLTDRVVQAIPAPQVDLNEIVERLKEFLPEGGTQFDVVALQTAIEEKVGQKIETAFESLAGSIKSRLETIREETRTGLDAAIEVKLIQYKDQMVAAVKEAGGPGTDGKGVAQSGDRWNMAIQVLDHFLDRQDPLSNIENLSNIYSRLGNIFGGGPDPTTIYKANQQILLEGIKLGAKGKGGGNPAGPLSSNRPAEHSKRPVRVSSKIDRIIQDL